MKTIHYAGWPKGMDNRSASHDLSRAAEAAVLMMKENSWLTTP